MITDYRKYLLIGPSSSGKSVLLASLISNLEKEPSKIWPGKMETSGGKLSFKVRKYGEGLAPFPYDRILSEVAHKGDWPQSTTGISGIRLEGKYSGSRWRHWKDRIIRDFVDIPGELFADFAGVGKTAGKDADYEDWSDGMLEHFSMPSDPESIRAMKDYESLLKRDKAATAATAGEIVGAYQRMMLDARNRYRYFISPATLVTRESVAGSDFPDSFAPIPHALRNRYEGVIREFKAEFDRYQEIVVRPLRQQIAQADGVIVPVDVSWILAGGMAVFCDQRRLLEEFGYYLGHLDSWLQHARSLAERLVFHKGSRGRLRSVVVCGTKLDVYRGEDRSGRLEDLVRIFTRPIRNGATHANVNVSYTACSGMQAARIDTKNPDLLRGRVDGREETMQPSSLPELWPADCWEKGQYIFGTKFEPILPQNMLYPPDAINLGHVLQLLEDA